MAISNIKLFDENKANMLTDSEYSTNTQRLNGVQSGVASSKLNNKQAYQVSLVAYAIGQLMAANGKDANDADAVSTFVANMDATLVQKVKDIASSDEVKAGVNNSHFMTPYTTKVAIEELLANPVTFGSTVTLDQDPTENFQAATKQYVDKFAIKKEFFCNICTDLSITYGDWTGAGSVPNSTSFNINNYSNVVGLVVESDIISQYNSSLNVTLALGTDSSSAIHLFDFWANDVNNIITKIKQIFLIYPKNYSSNTSSKYTQVYFLSKSSNSSMVSINFYENYARFDNNSLITYRSGTGVISVTSNAYLLTLNL